jgi:hypothetical protein
MKYLMQYLFSGFAVTIGGGALVVPQTIASVPIFPCATAADSALYASVTFAAGSEQSNPRFTFFNGRSEGLLLAESEASSGGALSAGASARSLSTFLLED